MAKRRFGERLLTASKLIGTAVRHVTGGSRQKSPYMFPGWQRMRPVKSLVDYQTFAEEGYEKNQIVFACIRKIATTAKGTHLRVERMVDGQGEAWQEHHLQRLFDRPNENYSMRYILEMMNTYRNLEGNAFLIKEKKGKQTEKLWLVRPDRMRPVPKEKELLGYVYVPVEGEKVPYLPGEVIHVKFVNPLDPFEGLGRGIPPLMAAAREVDIDNRATAFIDQFFKQAAVPMGVWGVKHEIDDAEMTRIRARIDEQYAGEAGWWKDLILDTEAEYQRIGLNMEEMAFPDLRSMSEVRICTTFDVPPILIGIKAGLEASTYSNYEQARKELWEEKVEPETADIIEAMNVSFADELGEIGQVVPDYSHVPAARDDRAAQFQRADTGVKGGWMTVNEARREVELGEVENGDVFLRPMMITEIGEKGLGMVPAKEKKSRKATREEMGAKFHKALDVVARAWEGRFEQAAREQFEKELPAMLAELKQFKRRKADEPWSDILKFLLGVISQNTQFWKMAYLPLFLALMDEQGETISASFGISWDLSSQDTLAWLENYAFTFAEQISMSTAEGVRQLVMQAQLEGWGVGKLADELQALYGGWSKDRALTIARTETIRSSNAGAEESYRQAGVERKEWYTALDERVCPFCGEMHGSVIAIGTNYFGKGDTMVVELPDDALAILPEGAEQKGRLLTMVMGYSDVGYPPLHPKCRCTLLPVIED